MNICFVYKQYPIDKNYDSGIGKYLNDLASVLKKKHNVIIITTSEKPRTIISEKLTIYAINYPKSGRRVIAFLKHIINIALILPKIIRRHNIEIIEFANWECEGVFFTLTINKFFKIPVVIRLHTPSFLVNKFERGQKRYFSEKVK